MVRKRRMNKTHWRERPPKQPKSERRVEFQCTYTQRPIETYQVCKHLDIFQAGREDIAEYVQGEMAHMIGLMLKEKGLLRFDTEPDPMNCGIVVRARVDVVRP